MPLARLYPGLQREGHRRQPFALVFPGRVRLHSIFHYSVLGFPYGIPRFIYVLLAQVVQGHAAYALWVVEAKGPTRHCR